MAKKSKRLICVTVIAFLAFLILFCAFLLPYLLAKNEIKQDTVLTVHAQDGGTLLLSWDESDFADRYSVELLYPAVGEDGSDEVLFSAECQENFCELPPLSTEGEVTVRLNTEVDYWHPWLKKSRVGKAPFEASCNLEIPFAGMLRVQVDEETDEATLSWDAFSGDKYTVFSEDENGTLSELGTVEENHFTVAFGSSGAFELPTYDGTRIFYVDTVRKAENVVYYGSRSDSVSVSREDFLGTELILECSDQKYNSYTLIWNETKGNGYEIRLMNADNGEWETIATYDRADELIYRTSHLPPFTDYRFQVVALGGQTLTDSEYSAVPDEVSFTTDAALMYATVWPLTELEVYSNFTDNESIGKAPAATAYCVLGEENGMFLIRLNDEQSGYIDSNYCLINLPEYLGNICIYDITNSYSSKYMVHEYEIPEVTDTVVEGYENIQLNSGEFLAPLLYPTAKRLCTAALAALSDGYKLKIYDSYRPNKASRSIYDLTLAIIDDPIPEETFTGEVMDDLPQTDGEEELTYNALVTDETYHLGYFLASGGSYHNMGIALDLTIVQVSDMEELEMQTSMHDLSRYSVISRNNGNAHLLNKYMKEAGFGGLISEWWHFQDNEIRTKLSLNTFMWQGVSAECWVADDSGWKYRRADGSFYFDVRKSISGTEYIFDRYGYAKLA